MTTPILYSFYLSSASWRIRTALAYKEINYEYRAINLAKSQQLTGAYLELNPSAQVPTLLIDGIKLTQSLPILEYLEETRPEKSLLPKDPVDRAQVRQIAEIVNSGIQPLQNLCVQKRIAELTKDEKKKAEWANYWIAKGLDAFEAILAQTAGQFCVGDEVTIADLCLVPQFYNATRFGAGVDLTRYPITSRIVDRCLLLEAFKKAHPLHQPDCPKREE